MDNEFVKGADDMIRRLNAAVHYFENEVPTVMGVEAVNHFKESFIHEGFEDRGVEKWAPRKTKYKGENGRPVLTGETAELADSIDYRIEGSTIIIYSDKPYAEIHNEGGNIPVSLQMKKYFWAQWHMAKEDGNEELMEQYKGMALAKEIKMVQRKFLGQSESLKQKITEKIVRDLTNILNR